ncbi:MAG: hypothetical protein Q8S73_37055 [Deltaproteobacteria bacterium]|nr:hypothetical protein [Myxococcales bacterium]MDP3219770.1 hypothetical protein [Deltaproteobacteria bacterium]
MNTARCHVCGRTERVLKDGRFCAHTRYSPVGMRLLPCEGSYQPAADPRLAARGPVYRAADSARRSHNAALAAIAHARDVIARTEARLPSLAATRAAAVEALAAFDRAHPVAASDGCPAHPVAEGGS